MKVRLFFLCFMVLFSSVVIAQDNVYDVARKGCADDMKQIIEEFPAVINYKDVNGHTPLILACYSGNKEVVEVLVDHVENINVLSDNGSALMAATFKGNVDIAKLLLEHGANVNATDLNGTTALHYAVQFTNVDIIKLLVEFKADIYAMDGKGLSALDYAKRNKNESIIELLNQ